MMHSGEPGFRYTLRHFVEAQGECDIFIEGGRQTMAHLILAWIDRQREKAIDALVQASCVEPHP